MPAVGVPGIVIKLTEAVLTGVAGPTELLAVSVYTPAVADDIFATVGFCIVEEKPLGPDQLHDVAFVAEPLSVNVAPRQTGLGVAVAVTSVGGVAQVFITFEGTVIPHAFAAYIL